MIKIDFHIHTVKTNSDPEFEFSKETIEKYVREAKLDAIAITNHNMFNLEQYNEIADAVPDSRVYPGIEIDLEKGHLLLIADVGDADDFAKKCNEVAQKEPSRDNSLSLDEFKQIFPDLGKYILIPHYDKKPAIPDHIIEQLKPFITAGEVTSPKKFMHYVENKSGLVPVYFSDSRMSPALSIPVKQTYLDCDDAKSFSEIKDCFSDRDKVFLSRDEGNELFKIFKDGQMLSTGLNVIIGKRSSGKSHTLNRIDENKHDFGKVKYIKQFSLVDKNDNKEIFDKLYNSLESQKYLKDLNNVIDDVMDIDIVADGDKVSSYIESLVSYAKMSEMHNEFSKAKLFSEAAFDIFDNDELEKLISATKTLVSNKNFINIIKKHLSIENIKKLYVELMKEHINRKKEIQKKKWLNDLIENIKGQLKTKTSAALPESINLYNIALNKKKIEKFEEVVKLARIEREIERKNFQSFYVIARSARFSGAGELRKVTSSTFGDAYKKYDSPYEYLQKLKDIDNLAPSDRHKCFVNIKYEPLNKDGFEVSGGERSELNLLYEIQDAQKYDILLIDEPESSFDNLFLKGDVSQIIKGIAKIMPVVLVTHNNTVGVTIRPHYLLYTEKEIEKNGNVTYRVYSGGPASKTLLSTDGKCINTRDITMNCLEAGEEAYNERGVMYDNLKN